MDNQVSYLRFTATRAKEMAIMEHYMNSKSNIVKICQQLPRHMRRRAASHNVKRVPRRLREQHKKQILKEGVSTSKRPSRKHRRRPKNLLNEYNRRQRRIGWLETHIWHAKRFHMTDRWGYRLALHCNDKNYRSTYRNVKDKCILMDVSYSCCLELKGPYADLVNTLRRVSSEELGPTFEAFKYIKGRFEGQLILYQADQYPYNAIGPVSFMWKPIQGNEEQRTIWIWCHPSISSSVLDLFIEIFQLKKNPEVDSIASEETSSTCCCYSNGNVTLLSLKDRLNRFRLMGPMSALVLCRTLRPVGLPNNDVQMNGDTMTSDGESSQWNRLANDESLASLPPHCIVGFNVFDPRLHEGDHNISTHSSLQESSGKALCSWNEAPVCDVWSQEIRDAASKAKPTTSQVSFARATSVDAARTLLGQSRVPVAVIRNPGVRSREFLGYGGGYDLILPRNWGKEFWCHLVHCGATARGLKDEQDLNLHVKELHFPGDYPDTEAGRLEELRLHDESKQEYFRRPPEKRCNFVRLGISSPFTCPWGSLVQPCAQPITVMRDRKQLTTLFKLKFSWTLEASSLFKSGVNYLVGVTVTLKSRGTVQRCAMICLPNESDIDSKFEQDILEPSHKDIHASERKTSRKEHKRSLTSLKKARSVEKKKGDEAKLKELKVTRNEKMETYKTNMEALCVPSEQSACRTVIGYVTSAAFSLAEGSIVGKGFCALSGLLMLLETSKGGDTVVWVRNTTSERYVPAWLDILHVE